MSQQALASTQEALTRVFRGDAAATFEADGSRPEHNPPGNHPGGSWPQPPAPPPSAPGPPDEAMEAEEGAEGPAASAPTAPVSKPAGRSSKAWTTPQEEEDDAEEADAEEVAETPGGSEDRTGGLMRAGSESERPSMTALWHNETLARDHNFGSAAAAGSSSSAAAAGSGGVARGAEVVNKNDNKMNRTEPTANIDISSDSSGERQKVFEENRQKTEGLRRKRRTARQGSPAAAAATVKDEEELSSASADSSRQRREAVERSVEGAGLWKNNNQRVAGTTPPPLPPLATYDAKSYWIEAWELNLDGERGGEGERPFRPVWDAGMMSLWSQLETPWNRFREEVMATAAGQGLDPDGILALHSVLRGMCLDGARGMNRSLEQFFDPVVRDQIQGRPDQLQNWATTEQTRLQNLNPPARASEETQQSFDPSRLCEWINGNIRETS